MAPPNNQKRVKGVQIFRPFMFGTSARKFNTTDNIKPAGIPEEHTHSWTVFVKGIDDTDITYWCRKVQFKLHESIPNNVRTIENIAPGSPFEVHETGWGEFEITFKIYYVNESNEKPQSFYHHLCLHPFGSDQDKAQSEKQNLVKAWCYEEQLFNEPYDGFYEILTNPLERTKGGGGKGTRVMKGGMVGSVGERTAMIPLAMRPDQPFCREAEKIELAGLEKAQVKVREMSEILARELEEKRAELERLQKGG